MLDSRSVPSYLAILGHHRDIAKLICMQEPGRAPVAVFYEHINIPCLTGMTALRPTAAAQSEAT